MKHQSLNGEWLYRIGKGKEKRRTVPFSALCVGHSECRKTFDLDYKSKRVFLKFDGITYHAVVTLNGVHIGDMLPYSEYLFDVTGAIKDKNNELVVEIEDIAPMFGPTAGWNNYGGIIRDVGLLYADQSYINDVFFYSEFVNGYTDAIYTVETQITEGKGCQIIGELYYENELVDRYISPATDKKTVRELKNVKLWSTDTPELYTLKITLVSGAETVDEYECKVGFREIKCNRHRFVINGNEVFLQGVCKHEMINGYGHSVPEELIENDLLAIKESGCNFVRLVHYPHSKKTLEIADRIGLMVSEEPGLWWSRTEIPEVSRGSLEVLERTVLRDRNHPCIAFWLSFNECRFTEQFLIASANVCKKLDPTRMISGANCMSNEDTLKYFNLCGFDFYTMHPYSDTPTRGIEAAKVLNDKPLLFTEWGGYHVYENRNLLKRFIKEFYSLYKQNSDEGAIAGAFFWYWREVCDYGRGRPACVDGVLKEALVDVNGEPTDIYHTFKKAWQNEKLEVCYEDQYYFETDKYLEKAPLEYIGGGSDYSRVLEKAKAAEWEKEKFNGMRYRKITVGPVMQETVSCMSKTPYVLSDGDRISFLGSIETASLTVVGAVSISLGYPISGKYGEKAADVVVSFADGTEQILPIRNGIELTTVYTSLGSSKIDPVAENTEAFAYFGYEKNFENYILNKLVLNLAHKGKIDKVTFVSADNGYDMLIYGIFS